MNPFDRFDRPESGNPFDQFDAQRQPQPTARAGEGFADNREGAWGGIQSYGQGAMQGLGDELMAGVSAIKEGIRPDGLPIGKAYDQALDVYRGARDQYREGHPVASVATEGAGALTSALLAAPALRAAGAAATPEVVANAGARVAQAAPRTAQFAQNVGIGAAGGGLYGFNEGEGGVVSRLEEGGKGAAIGGALGGTIPAVIGAVGAGARKMAQPVLDRMGPSSAASRDIVKALSDKGMTVDDAVAELQRLGPNATIADIIPNYAELVANTPGKGVEMAKILQQRMEGQGARLSENVNQGLSGQDVIATAEDLMAARSRAARPLYEQAVTTNNLIPSGDFRPIARDDFTRGVLREVKGDKLLGMQGEKANSMAVVDEAKKRLDDMIEVAKRQGRNNEARLLAEKRGALVGVADEAFPQYAEARSAWAGPTKAMEVMEAGRDFTKLDPRILAQQVGAMDDGGREFFRAGVADRIKEIISRTQDGADATRRIFGNERIREQIRATFPDEASFNAFKQQIEVEALFAKNRNQITGNSRTAYRQAGQEDMGFDPSAAVGNALMGNLGPAVRDGARSLATMLKRPPRSVGDQAAPMLFQQGDNAANIAALTQRAEAMNLTQQQRRSLARLLATGSGNLSGVGVGR